VHNLFPLRDFALVNCPSGHHSSPTIETRLRNFPPEIPTHKMQNSSPIKRALLIGIDDYPNLPPARQLYGCVNDVNLMHDLLLRRFGFAEGNINRLCNKEAARDRILKAFKDLVASVETNDVVVVHFSGHGSYLQDVTKGSGWTETIVPYDSGRKSTGHRCTDITDVEVNSCLLDPLVRKTPFVTLLFDSCHSGSILRDDCGTAVRGVDPDGEVRKNHGINSAELSGWLPTPQHRGGGSSLGGYALLASCRAGEQAAEIKAREKSYGAFIFLLCKVINESRNEDMRILFRLASAVVTAQFPSQHPILEGGQHAHIFGTSRLESPRFLYIKTINPETATTKMVEMDGGLASGVTSGSIWAVRPLGNSPQDSDARIKVKEAFAFVSRAEVIHEGRIEPTFGCFEISHAYGGAVLNILVDSQRDPKFGEFLSQSDNSNVSGTLNVVENAADWDVNVALLKTRSVVAEGDMVPQLGPLNRETWVALARDGRLILPPTIDLTTLCENLRKLARYRFGLRLRNIDEHNELRGKLSLELRRRPKGSVWYDPWQDAPMGMDGFPHFQDGDQIACVVTNHSNVAVWPYVLEFAEDGSVHQRYPNYGGEEQLASGRSTKEVTQMALGVSSENAFQLAEDNINIQDERSWTVHRNDGVPRSRKRFVTEVLKLFASTERIDLSLLFQTSFAQVRGVRGLSSLLRIGKPLGRGNVCASWTTVEQPFVLESDLVDADGEAEGS
jgi:hypothetical protein